MTIHKPTIDTRLNTAARIKEIKEELALTAIRRPHRNPRFQESASVTLQNLRHLTLAFFKLFQERDTHYHRYPSCVIFRSIVTATGVNRNKYAHITDC